MKGQLLPIWDAVVVALIGSAIVIVCLVAFTGIALFNDIPGSSKKGTQNVYGVVIEQQSPFYLAEDLQHLRIDDRQFLEHAIESMWQNATTSDNIKKSLIDFSKPYDFNYYRIYQELNKKVFYDVSSSKNSCGINLEGICTTKWEWPTACGDGREAIQDDKNVCQQNELCCARIKNPTNVITCGRLKEGLCTSKAKKTEYTDFDGFAMPYVTLEDECGEGREKIDSTECPQNTICCIEKTQDKTIGGKIVQIPILYKNNIDYVTVTAGQMIDPKVK